MSPAPFARPCIACAQPIKAGTRATWIAGRGLAHPPCAAAVALSSVRRPLAPGALFGVLERLSRSSR
jgi:hypothetical protein